MRTLVFRGWAGSTALDLLTDGRSDKPAELAHQPAVELCWLLPRARSQFRLLQGDAPFPAELSDDVAMPEHFRLLRIALEQVELLELRDHPHRRRRWRRRTGWSEEPLNP